MALVPLTGGKFATIDDADLCLVSQYKWQACKLGAYSKTLYAYAAIRAEPGAVTKDGRPRRQRNILMHRLILGASNRSEVVDHINRDGLDNRRANLRLCSQAENSRNRRVSRNSMFGASGVHQRADSGKFVAYIGSNKTRLHLGTFDTLDEARRVGAAAEIAIFGEFRAQRHCHVSSP